MKYVGMARHSKSAFNEKNATRMLAEFLEQKHTIATFFKENDRTPNYDGAFELVGKDDAPTKQFIVQIKKVENLTPSTKKTHQDKYVYNLDTSFLYYVKEKVVESPAIYFVVDIATKNIFWLYLSDELLMSLNFEGKQSISYPFSKKDIVPDIDTFVQILSRIAEKRNRLFLLKTPEQISEMQDALDYINRLMENDFKKIKESVFPNLWRFGIQYTPGETVSISTQERTITSQSTSMFALYPQIKGVADTGLQEYSGNWSNYFNHFDMLGKTTPLEYSRDTLHRIIKSYFENGIPATQLPNVMLFEKLGSFVQRLQRFYDFKRDDGNILISDLYNGFLWLLRYIQYIIITPQITPEEIVIKSQIIDCLNRGKSNFFDIFHCGSKVVNCFKLFCSKYENPNQADFIPDLVFKVIPKSQIEAFVDLAELKQRGAKYYEIVWTYDFFELTKLNENKFMTEINAICNKWFSEVPSIYDELYDALFETNKYRVKKKVEYQNEYISNGHCGPWLSSILNVYKANSLSIVHNPVCIDSFWELEKVDGLLSIHSGIILERFLQRKVLFYDSVRYLLYQGICEKLEYKTNGLSFDGMNFKLF